MIISPDLLVQHVNRGHLDAAHSALLKLKERNLPVSGFSTTNVIRAVVKLSMVKGDTPFPKGMFSHYYLDPKPSQLTLIIKHEQQKALDGCGTASPDDIKRVANSAVAIMRAVVDDAPPVLQPGLMETMVHQLLRRGYPKSIALSAEAFKPYRDFFLNQDLGL